MNTPATLLSLHLLHFLLLLLLFHLCRGLHLSSSSPPSVHSSLSPGASIASCLSPLFPRVMSTPSQLWPLVSMKSNQVYPPLLTQTWGQMCQDPRRTLWWPVSCLTKQQNQAFYLFPSSPLASAFSANARYPSVANMERARKTVEDIRAQEKLEIQDIGSLGYT